METKSWMIHLDHHSYHKFDITPANRNHPLESLIRFTFTLLATIIVGALTAYVFYLSVSFCNFYSV